MFNTAFAAEAPITVSNKLTTDKAWSGAKLPGYTSSQPELKLSHFVIKPGAKTSVHLHPSNGAGYMISGQLTMFATTDPNGSFDDTSNVSTIELNAGESWAETVNTWHYGVNNSDEDAVFIITFASEPGVPVTMSK